MVTLNSKLSVNRLSRGMSLLVVLLVITIIRMEEEEGDRRLRLRRGWMVVVVLDRLVRWEVGLIGLRLVKGKREGGRIGLRLRIVELDWLIIIINNLLLLLRLLLARASVVLRDETEERRHLCRPLRR